MSNVEYIIAAYAITLGALAVYGLYLWRSLRLAERELQTLMPCEGEHYGRQ